VPLERLAAQADVNVLFFATVLKVIGIAYIAEFGAQIARDAGVGTVAGKIELFGKLSIIVLAIPIVTAVVDTVQHLLP
jgi:stage III sporulation protein AD